MCACSKELHLAACFTRVGPNSALLTSSHSLVRPALSSNVLIAFLSSLTCFSAVSPPPSAGTPSPWCTSSLQGFMMLWFNFFLSCNYDRLVRCNRSRRLLILICLAASSTLCKWPDNPGGYSAAPRARPPIRCWCLWRPRHLLCNSSASPQELVKNFVGFLAAHSSPAGRQSSSRTHVCLHTPL